MAKVIGISGPDGGGKGYLTEQALAKVPALVEIAMVTTRPSRGESETKQPITSEDYQALLEANQLVGHHENNGNFYAYKIEDIQALDGNAIIELNPAFQAHLADELKNHGLEMAGWIGLTADPEYLAHNMNSRTVKDTGKDADPELIKKKIDMAQKIMDMQKGLADSGTITIFPVGWDNRETMGDEIAELIQSLL